MTRLAAATLTVAMILSLGSTARGQPIAPGSVQDADPAPAVGPATIEPAAPPQPAPAPPQLAPAPCCCCGMAMPMPILEPSERELTAVIAGGTAAAIVAYLFSAVYASTQPRGLSTVEGIPVAGAIVAAARNPSDDRSTPLLLFSAGVQAIGILVAAVAGAELSERRRLNVEVGPCAGGATLGVTWRY